MATKLLPEKQIIPETDYHDDGGWVTALNCDQPAKETATADRRRDRFEVDVTRPMQVVTVMGDGVIKIQPLEVKISGVTSTRVRNAQGIFPTYYLYYAD